MPPSGHIGLQRAAISKAFIRRAVTPGHRATVDPRNDEPPSSRQACEIGRQIRSMSSTRTRISRRPSLDAGSSPALTRRRSVSTLTPHRSAARCSDIHTGT